jgi:hypothetical protein
MDKEIKHRLEYSETQGFFHFEESNKDNKNTNDYYSLCDNITEKQCIEFTEMIFAKYPNVNTINGNSYPNI